jgi:hypothetical protein
LLAVIVARAAESLVVSSIQGLLLLHRLHAHLRCSSLPQPRHSPLRSTVHLPPAWFLPQYEHHSRPGHRAGLVREMPLRIAAGQRRSEHCRWLGGHGTQRWLPLAKVHVQAIELVAQNDEAGDSRVARDLSRCRSSRPRCPPFAQCSEQQPPRPVSAPRGRRRRANRRPRAEVPPAR